MHLQISTELTEMVLIVDNGMIKQCILTDSVTHRQRVLSEGFIIQIIFAQVQSDKVRQAREILCRNTSDVVLLKHRSHDR